MLALRQARAVEGVLQVRFVDEEGEVVRVVDLDTAKRLDGAHREAAAGSDAAERPVRGESS